eukprot:CAMPEP_0170476950 /NCGR_PEP_ID=MMETSP0123-20130129/18307_1 /TAXON_ID=182087 /ORGANISM="Favella ehrenbergii, Strain Fehren 1" /LENGTH=40 /DNA_ID= /DNA_START= /DNA_END= /DNA_ORIENTATION=
MKDTTSKLKKTKRGSTVELEVEEFDPSVNDTNMVISKRMH